MRVAAPYLGLGIQLAVAVIFFFFLGSWIDDRYNLSPYGKLSGALLGFVGGFIKFFKAVNELASEQDKKQRDAIEN